MKKVGLIAGNGNFPLLFAREAKKRGYFLVAIAIKGETSTSLGRIADKIFWLKAGELTKCFSLLKEEKIKEAVMAGQIHHHRLFKEKSPDKELKFLLKALPDKRTDSILGAIAERLEEKGINLLPSHSFLSHLLAKEGILTRRKPTEDEWKDVKFGREIANAIAGLDIGQTVCVKNGVVLAIEAIEGTNRTIQRASQFTKGVVIVKKAKPNQDLRFDIPVIGIRTIRIMAKSGAKVLAIDPEKTLLLDKEKVIALSDQKGISLVVGLPIIH
ncbi:MAG: UDP-2,3-diacylglucosamine diphosphatase LpxI [Candidatus Omnitrophica bacterium]|nr:UDP-2,3-diacylglucosamine diphosphatase LpxI [Candidatus Omnitrophota bacterium]